LVTWSKLNPICRPPFFVRFRKIGNNKTKLDSSQIDTDGPSYKNVTLNRTFSSVYIICKDDNKCSLNDQGKNAVTITKGKNTIFSEKQIFTIYIP